MGRMLALLLVAPTWWMAGCSPPAQPRDAIALPESSRQPQEPVAVSAHPVSPTPVHTATGAANADSLSSALPDSKGLPVLRVFYYHPADHPPLENYQPRLEKLLRHAQEFYAREMSRYGLPTANLRLDARNGRLVIRPVRGRLKLSEHERGKCEASIEADVAAAMKQAQIDGARETVLVFSNLLVWNGGQNREVGPYYGRWDAARRSGLCYAYDDPLLDPDKLSSREPGGWYVDHPCSVGQFNSHYIGGTLHELGHALGLPHESQSSAELGTRGTSMMGAGNHTYGQELRGESRGTFLTETSAFGLAQHPLFRADSAVPAEPAIDWKEFRARKEGAHLLIQGRLASSPPPFCITAFADPAGNGDYDATTDTVPVDSNGNFELKVPDLQHSVYDARIIVTAVGGGRQGFSAPFVVGTDGKAELSQVETQPDWQKVHRAWTQGLKSQALTLAKQTAKRKPNANNRRRFEIFETLARAPAPLPSERAPASLSEISLTKLVWASASVGWGSPQRDQAQPFEDRNPLLTVGGKFYGRGLFAHAPSKYVFKPGKRWRKLVTNFGIQDGLGGSVVFIIRTDGKEVFRSQPVRTSETGRASVSLQGVTTLELATEDAGDNNYSDWGLWLSPTLLR